LWSWSWSSSSSESESWAELSSFEAELDELSWWW
jgi:hypothetical protein